MYVIRIGKGSIDTYEYKIIKVGGIFKLRTTKTKEIEKICSELGKEGWELSSIVYDSYLVSYQLFFKRKVT